jgi:hypothetical protein
MCLIPAGVEFIFAGDLSGSPESFVTFFVKIRFVLSPLETGRVNEIFLKDDFESIHSPRVFIHP